MEFTVNFEINGEPSTWEDILRRVSQTAKAAAEGMADMSKVFEELKIRDNSHRRKVDDFIRWWAVHQDDGMVEV